jgi:hypothetical protein
MDKFECGACKYALPVEGNDTAIFCRRYPPFVIPRTDGRLGMEFPQMLTTGWCGEFQSTSAIHWSNKRQ